MQKDFGGCHNDEKKKCKNIELFTFYYYILFYVYLVAAALIVWITNHQEIYQFLPLM